MFDILKDGVVVCDRIPSAVWKYCANVSSVYACWKTQCIGKKIIVNLQLCGASFKAKLFILFT